MAAETLARFGAQPRPRLLTIMTNGGGAGVMAADAAALAGVALTRARRRRCATGLDALLPPTGRARNPIDIIGDAPVARYTETLQALLADRGSGAVLFMHAPTAIVRSDDIARACVPLRARRRRAACWLLARRRRGGRGAAHLRGRRRGRLRHARGGGARVRAARHLPAQPGAAAGSADGQRARPARHRPARARRSMRRWPQAATCSTSSRPRRCSPPTASQSCRRVAAEPSADAAVRRRGAIGYPGGAEDPVARHHPQVRRRRRRLDLHDDEQVRRPPRRCWRACARRGRRPRIDGFTCRRWCGARRAGADRRRQHRSGVRPGAPVRPGRHGGRGGGRPRRRRCRR